MTDTEIQIYVDGSYNSSTGDFWQNDDNILNERYEVRFPKGKNVTDYGLFKIFVSNIMWLPIELLKSQEPD